ncbi:Sorting nexin, cytoplasm-to-vacuole targeting pathway/endosomal sorting, partial [Podochytrium sp. JEL0797]
LCVHMESNRQQLHRRSLPTDNLPTHFADLPVEIALRILSWVYRDNDPLAASFHNDDDDDDEDDESFSLHVASSSSHFDAAAANDLQKEIDSALAEKEEDEDSHATPWDTSKEEATEDSSTDQAEDPVQADQPVPQIAKPCCQIDRILIQTNPHTFNPVMHSGPLSEQAKPAIRIEETIKISDTTSTHTEYLIRTTLPSLTLESHHRYSAFESFHRLLRRMHPTLLIPPIPEKHSVSQYAVHPLGKPKEDLALLELRKRGLQTFLNRVAMHPVLKRMHIFHLFLGGSNGGGAGGVAMTWNEILVGSGVAHFLRVKDVKKAAIGLKLTDSLLKSPGMCF